MSSGDRSRSQGLQEFVCALSQVRANVLQELEEA